MKLCPKCGSMMMPKKVDGKSVLACSCGHKESAKSSKKGKEKKKVEVIEETFTPQAKTKEDSPKCGNDEAYYEIKQMRSADEAPTRFMKCTKCKYTWRESD